MLCRRLEGLPITIELAAAWAGVVSPEQAAKRLDRRFDLLVSRQPASDGRQASLQATLDWSFRRLKAQTQDLFACLSLFRGGWTLAAAEALDPRG